MIILKVWGFYNADCNAKNGMFTDVIPMCVSSCSVIHFRLEPPCAAL